MDILFVIGLPRSGTSLIHTLAHKELGRKAPRLKDFGIDPKNEFPREANEYLDLYGFNKTLKTKDSLAEDGEFKGTIQEYREWLEKRGKSWVCKDPNHIAQLPLLMEVFPEAKFLWCLRDARDMQASVVEYFGAFNLRWQYNPEEAVKKAVKIAEANQDKFKYIDVEKTKEWDSKREGMTTFMALNINHHYRRLRGVIEGVSSSQFKERYRTSKPRA